MSYTQDLLPSKSTHVALIGECAHVLGRNTPLVSIFNIPRRGGLYLPPAFDLPRYNVSKCHREGGFPSGMGGGWILERSHRSS